MFEVAKSWVKDRLSERTSLDGAALIVTCGAMLLFDGLIALLAWVGLIYGIYTLVKPD